MTLMFIVPFFNMYVSWTLRNSSIVHVYFFFCASVFHIWPSFLLEYSSLYGRTFYILGIMPHCLWLMVYQFPPSLCFSDLALAAFVASTFMSSSPSIFYFMFSFFISLLGNAFPTLRWIFIWYNMENIVLQWLLFLVVLLWKGVVRGARWVGRGAGMAGEHVAGRTVGEESWGSWGADAAETFTSHYAQKAFPVPSKYKQQSLMRGRKNKSAHSEWLSFGRTGRMSCICHHCGLWQFSWVPSSQGAEGLCCCLCLVLTWLGMGEGPQGRKVYGAKGSIWSWMVCEREKIILLCPPRTSTSSPFSLYWSRNQNMCSRI